MNIHDLLGTWKLHSFEGVNALGEKFLPFGNTPLGTLMYTERGEMSVFMSKPHRNAVKAITRDDLLHRTDEVLKSIHEDFNAYAGTFVFEEQEQKVIHHITVSYFHEWIGTSQERFCELAAGDLLLKTPPTFLDFKKEKEWWFELVWKRNS